MRGFDRTERARWSVSLRKEEADGVTRHLESRGRWVSSGEEKVHVLPPWDPRCSRLDVPRESRGGGRVQPVCEVEVIRQGRVSEGCVGTQRG